MLNLTTFVDISNQSYTSYMNILVQPTAANKPKTADSQKIAYFYVIILTVFALSQLFDFNNFLSLFDSFGIFSNGSMATLLASFTVVAEVLAIPFLLGMSLSPLMRMLSMLLGWAVPAIWLFISIWINYSINSVSNIGFLGTKVQLMPGSWAVLVPVALGILAAWASWGMWPSPLRSRYEK